VLHWLTQIAVILRPLQGLLQIVGLVVLQVIIPPEMLAPPPVAPVNMLF